MTLTWGHVKGVAIGVAIVVIVAWVVRSCLEDGPRVDWKKIVDEQQKGHDKVLKEVEEAYEKERLEKEKNQRDYDRAMEESKRIHERDTRRLSENTKRVKEELRLRYENDPQGLAREFGQAFHIKVMERPTTGEKK